MNKVAKWGTCGVVLLGAIGGLAVALHHSISPNVETHSSATSDSSESSNSLRNIVAAARMPDLRWPNFPDYRVQMKNFYEPSDYSLAWVRDNRPTSQALSVIEILRKADSKGLNAEDYDASRWSERVNQLRDPAAAARFDAALTICVMRYGSDLEVGRVNPKHFQFGLTEKQTRYDLPHFVRERLVNGQDAKSALDEVEPQFPGYRRTEAALQQYLELSGQDDGEQLPVPPKSLAPASQYAGVPRLTRLLRLIGDIPADAVIPPGDVYQGPLVGAVKHFQKRHGLTPDGRLGPQTIKQMNVPLSRRVEQLRLEMERWRWLPHEFPQPPVLVNIPEFRLRAFSDDARLVLSMNVIVGKAMRHETPVFDEDMRYVVLRPYWNVTPSIQRSEIVPAIERNRNYIANKNYEVVTQGGAVVTSDTIDDDVLEQLRAGKLAVRQKPGPNNALGLVKLIFPNEYNVYLHSTPTAQLFSQSRRDFSHGCIRVEKPAELASWVLRDKPEWTLARIREAMQSGSDNVQVNLTKPIPVLILYGTAVVEEDNTIHFFDDIYSHDQDLEKALARGYPYPN